MSGDRDGHQRPDARVVAVGVLCVATLLAGCGAVLDDGAELPNSEEVAEKYESLDAYSATFVFNFPDDGPKTQRLEGTVTIRPGTGAMYQEVDTGDGRPDQTIVSNGTVAWRYNESADVVRRTEAGQWDTRRQQIRQVIARIKANDSEETDTPLLPITPFGPGFGASPESGTGLTSRVNFSTTARYEGTESVSGRQAHVLVVEATDGARAGGQWTYYLDTEWYVLLRSSSNVTVGGERMETSFRLRNITFNPEIPADRFEFTPPEGVTVKESNLVDGRYESRKRLAAATDLAVPDPDVPGQFELSEAVQSPGVTESITLQYTSDVATLTVTRRDVTTFGRPGSNEERIQVGDRNGTYRQFPREAQVRWECSETTQLVTGPLARETLVDIAASIEC